MRKLLYLLIFSLGLFIGLIVGLSTKVNRNAFPTLLPILDFTPVEYAGSTDVPQKFTFSYPDSWHVWYSVDLLEDEKSSGSINVINMNPTPIHFSKNERPAIVGQTINELEYLEELKDVEYLDYELNGDFNICYYAVTGAECRLQVGDNSYFKFTLRDELFFQEFEGVIKSILL